MFYKIAKHESVRKILISLEIIAGTFVAYGWVTLIIFNGKSVGNKNYEIILDNRFLDRLLDLTIINI